LVFGLTALALVEIAVSRVWPRSDWLWLMLPLVGILLLMIIQTLPWGGPPPGAATLPVPAWWAVSFDPYETRFTAFRLLALMLTGALLFRYTNSPRRLRVLVLVVVGIAVLSALFALARMAGQRGEGFVLPRLPNGEKRAGQFINRNHFAFMLEMAFGLLAGIVAGRGVGREKWPLLFGAALLLWALLVMGASRGGLLAFTAQLVFVGLLFGAVARGGAWSRSWALRGTLLAALLLGVGAATIWLGGDDLAARLQQSSTELRNEQALTAEDKTNRAAIWRATWQMFKDYPVTGVGLGGYWTAIPGYHQASGRLTPRQAHNDYLEILASGGVIGFALALWFVVLLLRRARPRLNSHDPWRRAVCFGALVGLFGAAVHSLVDFGLHLAINALLFTMLCVLATVDERAGRRRGETHDAPARAWGAWAYAGAAAGVLLCAAGAWSFGWMGMSRLLSDYARVRDSRDPRQLEAAQRALRATPDDTDAHSALGLVLLAAQRKDEALRAFAEAVARRPRDYVMWLQLGRAYDIAGREKESLTPFREAARLAPFYAQPPWQLGNTLFRQGQTEEGFAALRRAAQSDPDLLPGLVDLAWGAFDGDAAQVVRVINPETPPAHLAVGRYLLKKRRPQEAAAQLRAAGPLADKERAQLVQDCMAAGTYRLAFELWLQGKPAAEGIVNAGFEDDTRSGETAFGWRWQRNEAGVTHYRDPNQPQAGQFSFRLDYKNQEDPARETLAQVVAVEPKSRYRLTFAARTAQMSTAGWPTLFVADTARGGAYIGQAEIKASDAWRTYTVEFATGEKTDGVVLYLRRQNCAGGASCAIFGSLWLDGFALRKD
jgi:O-antigen ligase/tetratricopeptide (TPR) repeat protein